ncbi:MAG: adenosine deaminase [Draconibacterium sp.]|nr:adenosine deaminase [Draconibacterium sp.]
MSIEKFVKAIPKAELHVHIEGTLEPELMFKIAARNNILLQYQSVEELKMAYKFNNLQSFLDIYYAGAKVLITEPDFYELTRAYLEKAHSQNVLHVEIMFDPQTHTNRGIEFKTVISGISRALTEAQTEWGITSNLIMCFLRHLSEDDAIKTFEMALNYKDLIFAVGLDSSEKGHPPSKFQRVFEMALKEGFKTVAHAGEEGPADYVWEALDLLKVSRIDHGNNSLNDDNLIQKLIGQQIPLTVCPLSNLKLKVVTDLKMHPLKKMLEAGLLATVNSDDPSYFGGYINENFLSVAEALNLSKQEIALLAINSFKASFLEETSKQEMIEKVQEFFENS